MKRNRALLIIVEFILLVLTIISLYDGFSEICSINLTPLFTTLMMINIVIAVVFMRKK